jgi:hypothetical protein
MDKTTVINRKHRGRYDVYIGRGSPFGNPYDYRTLGITRDESILKYREWFYRRLTDPWFRDKVHSLKGKVLACWCKPDACHGDIIVEYLENEYQNVSATSIGNKPSEGV